MTMQDDFEGVGFGDVDGDVVLLTERGAAAVATNNFPKNARHQNKMILEALYEESGGQAGVAVDVDALVMSANIGGPGIVRIGLNQLVDMGFAQKAEMGQPG